MTYTVDGDWSCSRCQSFGVIKPGEEPRCECDETEDQLRTDLSTSRQQVTELRAARDEACDIAERLIEESDFPDDGLAMSRRKDIAALRAVSGGSNE